MKKPVALLTSALLATTVVLGATSCASKNVEKLLPDGSIYSVNNKTVTALTKDDVLSPMSDMQGLILVTKVNKNSDGEPVSTTYKLFDAVANAFVSGVEYTVPEEPAEVAADALTKTETSTSLMGSSNGLYYTVKTTYTRESAEVDWADAETKTEYTLYGKNGKVAENVEGSFNTAYTQFETKDGTRYYIDLNGNVAKESDPLARILTLGDSAQWVGDYFIKEVEDFIYAVYDKSGKYVRTVNGAYELDIPSNIDGEPAMWSVGNYMFVQYSVQLPENENKYDYIGNGEDGALKYDLVTKRYDLEKGKIKDIDMEYVVDVEEGSMSLNDETVLLYVNEIKDEQIMDAYLVQSFNEKGKVAVDLQKLVPGADDLRGVTEDALVLESGDMEYVVEGKKVIGEFVSGSVSYMNNVAYTNDATSGTVRFYNLDGSLNKAYTDIVDTTLFNEMLMVTGAVYFQLEGSVVKYDTKSKTETVVCTYDKDNGMAYLDDETGVIQVLNYGADKEADTDDDTYSVYFLVEGPSNLVNLSEEEIMKYDFNKVNSYQCWNINGFVSGAIYALSYTTGEGEAQTTTVTYYATEISMDMSFMMMM